MTAGGHPGFPAADVPVVREGQPRHQGRRVLVGAAGEPKCRCPALGVLLPGGPPVAPDIAAAAAAPARFPPPGRTAGPAAGAARRAVSGSCRCYQRQWRMWISSRSRPIGNNGTLIGDSEPEGGQMTPATVPVHPKDSFNSDCCAASVLAHMPPLGIAHSRCPTASCPADGVSLLPHRGRRGRGARGWRPAPGRAGRRSRFRALPGACARTG